LVLTLSWSELQRCSHAPLAPCKILSTISQNYLVAFSLVADYYYPSVLALNSTFHLCRQIEHHNTLLAMQRLSERKSCMLGLVVLEIQVVPWQRGNLLVSYYTLQIKYNIQASGQLPKWTVIWLEFMNQVKDFKTLKVNTFRLYPPSTRTPFIWVRCIFFNKERESATSIFLQPSRSKICCAKNTKYSGH